MVIIKGQVGSVSSRKQCIEGNGSQQNRTSHLDLWKGRYLEWVVERTGDCTSVP